MRRALILSLILFALAIASFAQSETAESVVAKWRKAVHAEEPRGAKAAVLTSTSNEDGIPGQIEEWYFGENYRRVVTREFDEAEIVVTGRFAQRLDWNGFVRDVQGQELRRLRTAIFENQVLIFGPPQRMSEAEVSQSDDHKFYLLRITPEGGSPMTWYVDPATWLPAKSVRPGDDTEITTSYEDWRDIGGMTTPHRVRVSETDKPDYPWERTSLRLEAALPRETFQPPKPGPPDVHMNAKVPPIPFNFENSHIMLKVAVNDREPIWFILDTGADQEAINETRLADFGLVTYAQSMTTGGGGSAEYSYATGASFSLPGVKLLDQHVAVIDQTGLERALGMPIGGLLGYDFISRFVVEIDYQKQLITLHDPNRWRYSGKGLVVPITFDEGIPFINGTISAGAKRNLPAYLVLDFGAAETMTLTSPFVKANDLLSVAQTNANVNRPAGLENQFFAQNNVRGHIDQLMLGKLIVQSIPVNLSMNTKGAYASANFSGTVGESIFRRYHVFLDYARKRMIFEPTADADKPFPERQTYGLTLLASGADLHSYTVTAVRPGSQAERDGFKKGDVISGMDRKPAIDFTLGELREQLSHPGERHELQITRGTENLTVPIEVKLVSLDKR
jgi:hypothetical protein